MEKNIITENIKGRTLEVILADIDAKVNTLNAEKEMGKRITLESEVDGLLKEYNDLSLLTAYATCKAEALPIMALAKMCKYTTLGKKKTPTNELQEDGTSKRVEVFAVTKKDTTLNVLKFIKWLEERNFKMPEGWIGRMSAVKAEVIDQWKAFDKSQDEHVFNKKRLRKLTQAMVNDMGFIPGEKGGNALVVKNEHINPMIKYANEKTGVQSGKTLSAKNWDGHLMTILNSLATGAVFEDSYGSAAVYKDDAVASTEDGTEAEATAPDTTQEAPATAPAEEASK